MTNTPSNFSKRAYELGMTFLLLHESQPEAMVSMMDSNFNVCGTIACHAGWFAIARGNSKSPVYSYVSAANDLAKFLGFKADYDLELWADENKTLWGNDMGSQMFCHRNAFTKSILESLTLSTIGNHWLGVAARAEQAGM